MTRKSSGETLAQIKAEAANPRGDVWWGGTGDPHLQAAEEGLTVEYKSPKLADLHLAVARALVLEPSILLFDEPLSNLDARLRRKVREDIRALQKDLGLTVVYVTHDQEEALAVSDEVIVMSNARIAQKATPRDLWELPANLFVADFIGDANVVDGHITALEGDVATLDLAGAVTRVPARGHAMGAAKVAIRPDALAITPATLGALGSAPGGIPGSIKTASYLGKHLEYEITTALGDLFLIAPADREPISVGGAVSLHPKGHGIAIVPTP